MSNRGKMAEWLMNRIELGSEITMTQPNFTKTLMAVNSMLVLGDALRKCLTPTEAAELGIVKTLEEQVELLLERADEDGTVEAFADANMTLDLAERVFEGLLLGPGENIEDH